MDCPVELVLPTHFGHLVDFESVCFLKVKKNLDERWNLQQRLEMAERVAAENVEKANHVNRKFELEQAGKINQTGTSVVVV